MSSPGRELKAAPPMIVTKVTTATIHARWIRGRCRASGEVRRRASRAGLSVVWVTSPSIRSRWPSSRVAGGTLFAGIGPDAGTGIAPRIGPTAPHPAPVHAARALSDSGRPGYAYAPGRTIHVPGGLMQWVARQNFHHRSAPMQGASRCCSSPARCGCGWLSCLLLPGRRVLLPHRLELRTDHRPARAAHHPGRVRAAVRARVGAARRWQCAPARRARTSSRSSRRTSPRTGRAGSDRRGVHTPGRRRAHRVPEQIGCVERRAQHQPRHRAVPGQLRGHPGQLEQFDRPVEHQPRAAPR